MRFIATRMSAAAALLGVLAFAPAAAAYTPPVTDQYGPSPEEVVTIFPTARTTTATAGRASTESLTPSVVLVHGGGWRKQVATTEQTTVAQGLRANGFTVFDVNYPQDGPGQPAFPKQPNAIAAAVGFVRAHAASFGSDPNNIVLLGGSAGGNLVDLVGETMPPGVRGVVSLSGPTNLTALYNLGLHEEIKYNLAVSLAEALACGGNKIGYERLLGCTAENLLMAEQFSPVANVSSPCTSWFLASAETDLVPISQQRELLSALQAKGCTASLEVIPGQGHSFSYWPVIKERVISFIAAN